MKEGNWSSGHLELAVEHTGACQSYQPTAALFQAAE